jgi:hypothetical protein
MNYKWFGRKWSWHSRDKSWNLPRGIAENHEKLQDGLCPGKESNRAPLEYRFRVLPLDDPVRLCLHAYKQQTGKINLCITLLSIGIYLKTNTVVLPWSCNEKACLQGILTFHIYYWTKYLTDVRLVKYIELCIATVLSRNTVEAQHLISSFRSWVAIYRRLNLYRIQQERLQELIVNDDYLFYLCV